MTLLDTAEYTLTQKTKVIELTGEYTISSPDRQVLGTVVETGHGTAHKAVRAIFGLDTFLNRHLEVRDPTGTVVATVSRNRGLLREVVTVTDGAGVTVGQVRIRLFAPSLPLPTSHQVLDATGDQIGVLRTHGLRRRSFTLTLGGDVAASATQPWAGALREMFTAADRFTYRRHAEVPPALVPLVFALPLIVELSFKQGGEVSPLGEALSFGL